MNQFNIMKGGYEECQYNLECNVKEQQELLNQIREREHELERVHEYMNDLQRMNFIYQPVKDDPTDKKLAEYINNNQVHSKASLFFVREQEGVYTYGKKRIFIKSENDQMIVRVGGGYETIDRFIENHCPYEVRKRQKAQFNTMLNSRA